MRKYKNEKVSKETELEVIQLYLSGKSCNYIGKVCSISNSCAGSILKRNNIPFRDASTRCKKFSCNSNYFEIIDTPEKSYFLGLLYADGYINRNNGKPFGFGISLSGDDELQLLIKLKNAINYTGGIKKKKKILKKYKQPHVLTVCDYKIAGDLIKLGCIPKKSLVLQFPTEDQVPKHLIHHFIRGYIEGDGAISFKKDKRLMIGILSSHDFCNSLKKYIEKELNIFVGVYCYNQDKSSEVKICGSNALKLLNYIYDNNEVHLKRKKDIYLEYLDYYTKIMINSPPKNITEKQSEDIYKYLHLPDKDGMYIKFGQHKVDWIKKFVESGISQSDIMKIFQIRFSSFYKILDFLKISFKIDKRQTWLCRTKEYKEKLEKIMNEYNISLKVGADIILKEINS